MHNLAPERDEDEETGGGTDFKESNHDELQADIMIVKKIGDLRNKSKFDARKSTLSELASRGGPPTHLPPYLRLRHLLRTSA